MRPSSYNQRTLSKIASLQGVGLHSGARVTLTLRPAPPGHGIVFVRTDLARPVSIPALAEYVVDTSLATTLGRDGVRVGTVEHLMAALAGMGIDNLRVELDGPEVPIMDGSAAPFAALIQSAGVREQEAPKELLVIRKAVSVVDGDKQASLTPARHFRISCTIDFEHPVIQGQSFDLDFGDRDFAREISRARTFGFLRDVEKLKQMGLARGGSLENAIVVDEVSILNPDGLRFPDEFVRHKILDAIGDVSLFGRPVIGHMTAYKTGHALNHKLVRKVMSDPSCYEIVPARRRELEGMGLGFSGLAGALDFEPLVA
ncbi:MULTISPECIES: UDP-3-O-acyl-N-acetylglucosamine deacetylase [Myxococcus]|uniref:UDP-3-O-acyl-N-acetylglucosamine deacetylase n=2 Tax=Myxococcus TaxID=32 RepID=LPXC_MYXXD|nr:MULTISPECIES: UDP-3-O-acyl-N-acetylglucosamine deacetylase [Myxococcus]Q1D2K0.1 RecName: Full=UDP-3-O-acyl-N-acetylglucosamine deacetylase; Short=UDP-3-O-acyl-GlcNAc deacetylase; AltName: Full=UDP-3-O-[R-3-hydroxymyristoyl]-N-acetylglucosamine deacetylase [Myxococcus xanthus DK 1622]ABF86238.1 UDP-3-O-acyl N-acetylglycosamine deacetylase [Myxococcus xanthus DK 1622]NOJ55319.1 UDP-3-O-acyl-N-acetylglucosamine deacetylase [Myxococcus xanthus]NOK02446.1 UDP-3-O-acyl-N-acetylglucosamine deacetyl